MKHKDSIHRKIISVGHGKQQPRHTRAPHPRTQQNQTPRLAYALGATNNHTHTPITLSPRAVCDKEQPRPPATRNNLARSSQHSTPIAQQKQQPRPMGGITTATLATHCWPNVHAALGAENNRQAMCRLSLLAQNARENSHESPASWPQPWHDLVSHNVCRAQLKRRAYIAAQQNNRPPLT